MSAESSQDLSQYSMFDLFRIETENQSSILTAGLIDLEHAPSNPQKLEALMRAAHSLKGAARIINLDAAVRVAHAIEDCFVEAQKGSLPLTACRIDTLLRGVDLLNQISGTPAGELGRWETRDKKVIESFLDTLRSAPSAPAPPTAPAAPAPAEEPRPALRIVSEISHAAGAAPASARLEESRAEAARPGPSLPVGEAAAGSPSVDRVLRVTADNLNRLLGLAGESLVESRWLAPFASSLLRLKRMQSELGRTLEFLREAAQARASEQLPAEMVALAQAKLAECQHFLSERLVHLDTYDRRAAHLSHRLYHEALSVRMRPFADGVVGFSRMVRDIGRSLDKEVRLELIGENTQVDRDILERLEAPVTHLLRNAIDHGIESRAQRRAAGKNPTGTIRLEARHCAGMLQITVSDDGAGIDLEKLRGEVVAKGLTNHDTAAKLSESELLDFLFLPGFSTKTQVSEISGRGVGLDVVQSMARGVRGTVRVATSLGEGTRFQLQLPLTLSVMRTLLVEIGGEPYAFPLAYVNRTLSIRVDGIRSVEGQHYFEFDGRSIGLVSAHQILDQTNTPSGREEASIILIGGPDQHYGLAVDRFIGECELVVHPLDPRLGKLKNIAAGALLEDGSPVLIVDVDDLLRSVERVCGQGRLVRICGGAAKGGPGRRKRVLVVDDSLTVRELERKLLQGRGYEVEVAVDGMDGWNTVRHGAFDLVISDVDMPRMDGIEFVSQIKRDPQLKAIPTVIVSYKDRDEDRRRGLQAGADYYLTKGSFHDETLLDAVADLIGAADA